MIKNKTVIQELVSEVRIIVKKEELDLSILNKKLSRQMLLPYAQWLEDKSYTRVCLHECEEFEIILICWQPFAKTAIHNHNEQNCYVFFFDADFEEIVYCEEGKQEEEVKRIKQGGISFMREKHSCHSLQNLSDQPVMSLHVYNSPIKKCEIVEGLDNEASLNWATLKYDAIHSN